MNRKTIIGLMLLAASVRESVTQNTPTTSQLDRERQHIELERKRMFDPSSPVSKAKGGAMPNSADIDREMHRIDRKRKQMFNPNNLTTRNVTNVFPNVPTPERVGIDIEALTEQYEQKVQARRMDDLIISAGFAMPAESLKRIVSQTGRVRASVVLRGFESNSLKNTALAIKELGEQDGNTLVNPDAFTEYRVKAVPTVVLVKAATIDQVGNEGYVPPDNLVVMAGDVLLDYALDEIVHHASQSEAVASRCLRQIRRNQ